MIHLLYIFLHKSYHRKLLQPLTVSYYVITPSIFHKNSSSQLIYIWTVACSKNLSLGSSIFCFSQPQLYAKLLWVFSLPCIHVLCGHLYSLRPLGLSSRILPCELPASEHNPCPIPS